MDKLTKEQRHRCMSAVKSKNTKPELLVRKFLFSRGFRYRLNHPRLPGRPDLVLRKYRTVIFVNGCFWHGHNLAYGGENGDVVDSKCCRIPKTRTDFWIQKITHNMQRDYVNVMRYKRAGWHVLTVWECQLRGKEQQLQTLMALSQKINSIILDSYRLPKRYDFEPDEEMPMVAEESFVYEKK